MLAIIPARGGSKGLPGKNIRPLGGKPLIAHSIEAALKAKSITRVIVSTDCARIAQVSQSFGAEIPFLRPSELAQDDSLAIDNYIYTTERLTTEIGKPISEFVVLLPTAPLRISEDIDAAVAIFEARQADAVLTYYKAPHPVEWHCYFDTNGIVRNYLGATRIANRQDERQAYLPNGAIYVFKTELLVEHRTYWSERTFPYVMPRNRSVDIDSLEDFEYAELLLAKAQRDRRPGGLSEDEVRGSDGPRGRH